MVTVHIITYNEEVMIGFCIEHYRKKFPNCIIKIYDNYSTDNTVAIAEGYGCEISNYNSYDKFDEQTLIKLKDTCWKNSETDWVVVCDCDELIDITQEELVNEHKNGTTLFKFTGYNMVNTGDTINLNEICYGYADNIYDKILLFNKSKISEINYRPGCHTAKPKGIINYNGNNYNMLHYKFLGAEYTVNRYRLFANRLSTLNMKKKWSIHYTEHESNLLEFYKQIPSKDLKKLL